MESIEELNILYKKLENEINEVEYTTDTLTWYLNLINLPTLSKEVERILLYQISLGDKRARKIFIQRNLRLVKNIAFNYANRGLHILDLINEGNIGLINAVDNYKLSKNTAFSTYAYVSIENHIKRAIDEKARMITIPINKLQNVKKYQYKIAMLERKLQRKPTYNELSHFLDIDINTAIEYDRISMDTFLINDIAIKNEEEDVFNIFEVLHTEYYESLEEKLINRINAKNKLEEIFKRVKLNIQEIWFIKLKYGLDNLGEHNQSEISRIMGLSMQRVSQIKKHAYKKLNI